MDPPPPRKSATDCGEMIDECILFSSSAQFQFYTGKNVCTLLTYMLLLILL